MIDNEGYIKFKCNWKKASCQIDNEVLKLLNTGRSKLHNYKLIGVYPDGIGFGNISLRADTNNKFFITASATGKHKDTTVDHYSLVEKFNIKQNEVFCIGMEKASSESMTHAVVYEGLDWVNSVVHVHDLDMWEKLKDVLPTTSEDISYGTPEMAYEIQRLLKDPEVIEEKIIVMGGHREGILTFDTNIDNAVDNILIRKQNL